MNPKIRPLFFLAALYEALLGLAFLLFPSQLFEKAELVPPNHFGYVQFPAALLIVFGVMFVAIARDPVQNRNLIPYGILLKISYCSVVLFYWVTSDLPSLWKPFFVADLLFLAGFLWARKALSTASR